MKRKNTIILSLVMILMISVALIGFTYAYFRTRIVDETTDKTITLQNNKLKLTYFDGTAWLIDEEGNISGNTPENQTIAATFKPGFSVAKEFTVKNEGNKEIKYSVIFDEISNEFNRYKDWTYTLYKNGSEISTGTLVKRINQVLLAQNLIQPNQVDTYKVVVTYENKDENQSEDMNKKLSLRVNISDNFNPWEKSTEGTLTYVINNNNVLTSYLTTPGEKESSNTEAVYASAADDHGITHYFRGNVDNNYVNFAGMCWRIVRIAGDGSTKLVLEDQYTTCDDNENEETSVIYTGNWAIGTGNYGYDTSTVNIENNVIYTKNYLKPTASNATSMAKAFYNFQIKELANYTDKLKSGDWCLGDTAYTRSGSSGTYTYNLLEDISSKYLSKATFYYDSYTNLANGNINGYQPTFKCNSTVLENFADVKNGETIITAETPMLVSALTADEIAYAGGKHTSSNTNYYLINNYQTTNSAYFWSISPMNFIGTDDRIFVVANDGNIGYSGVNFNNRKFRPAVYLQSNIPYTSGDGTQEKPYIIN